MKALALTGVLLVGLVSAGYAADQAAPAAAAAQAQQQGMKTIFDYQKEVGLTDKQVADMQKVMGDLQNTLNDKAKELGTMRQALSDMIAKKDDMKSIKAQMQKIANLQVDNSCMDIEASRKVEQIMKPEQIAKWKEIQKKFAEEMMAQQAAQQAPVLKK
jgi:vacuolar-type H+-ATPase subunit I/STV1